MSDSVADKPQGVEYASEAPPKRGCMAGFRAHCKRFWWIYVIAFIIVVLVVVLPIIYVAYPKMAQDSVNDSTLTVTEMVVTDPRPDRLQLKIKQAIGTKSKFHPTLDAFEPELTLEGGDEPFAVLQVPSVKATDGVVAHIEHELVFPSAEAFTDYAKAVIHNETVEFNVFGETGLTQGSLPKTTVTYDTQVVMKGLDGLKGFNVTSIGVVKEENSDVNMRGMVSIPNPSVITLTMGNITLDLSVDGGPIGVSMLNNVVFRPGDNEFEIAIIGNQSQIVNLMMTKYKDGVVPIDITGKSCVYDGEDLPYFTAALASNTLHVELDLMAALS